MNLIQIYNFHHPKQRNNVHKCKHRKIAPNDLSPPPTTRTYRLTRKSLSGAKNAFFIFHISTANKSNFANEPRGANPDEWAATNHPCPTLLWTFNQRSPHLVVCWFRLSLLSLATEFSWRVNNCRLFSVVSRPRLRLWTMAYSPTETDLRPPIYDFDLADSEKIRIFASWKKNRISTTATTYNRKIRTTRL